MSKNKSFVNFQQQQKKTLKSMPQMKKKKKKTFQYSNMDYISYLL